MSEFKFKLVCPHCYSADHVAYRLRVHFGNGRPYSREVTTLDLGTPYGEAIRHCCACGLKFPAASGVELRALAPTTPHNERRMRDRDLSQDGDRSWSRV